VTEKHPAEDARGFIGEALEAVQDDASAEDALSLLATTLAGAQASLFEASRFAPRHALAVQGMRKAMEFLARALQLLQDLKASSKAVEIAASAVASSLTTLYAAVQPKPGAAPSGVGGVALGDRPRDPGVAPPPSDKDRRLKTMQFQVENALDMQSDTQFYTGLSGRIDEGGIFVATFDIRPINTKVAVSFTLPGGETIVTKGHVRWVREYNPDNPDVVPGMGVGFIELTDQDRLAIERYLEQRAPLFYDDA
jgi:uncharacterized protein (TIGR02266 family)